MESQWAVNLQTANKVASNVAVKTDKAPADDEDNNMMAQQYHKW